MRAAFDLAKDSRDMSGREKRREHMAREHMAEDEGTSDAVFLVVAAGRGARAGAGGPKQYRELAGRQVLTRTLEALLGGAPDAQALVVIHADDRDLYQAAVAPLSEIFRARLFPGHWRRDAAGQRVQRLGSFGGAWRRGGRRRPDP